MKQEPTGEPLGSGGIPAVHGREEANTPTPRPHPPGPSGPRPGIPLPGQHLAGATAEFADPEQVRAEVEALLAELPAGQHAGDAESDGVDRAGADITRRSRILEQAHEVLVGALATVDKI